MELSFFLNQEDSTLVELAYCLTYLKFTIFKQKGGLMYPLPTLLRVVKILELLFTHRHPHTHIYICSYGSKQGGKNRYYPGQ